MSVRIVLETNVDDLVRYLVDRIGYENSEDFKTKWERAKEVVESNLREGREAKHTVPNPTVVSGLLDQLEKQYKEKFEI